MEFPQLGGPHFQQRHPCYDKWALSLHDIYIYRGASAESRDFLTVGTPARGSPTARGFRRFNKHFCDRLVQSELVLNHR